MSKIMHMDTQYAGITPEKDFSDLVDFFYPVGCYFETSDTTFNPNVSWSGYWVLETEGLVHISSGSNYAVSGAPTDTKDGGRKDAIVPSHTHGFTNPTVSGGSCSIGSSGGHGHSGNAKGFSTGSTYGVIHYGASGSTAVTLSFGGGDHTHTVPDHTHSVSGGAVSYAGEGADVVANANMQPYIIVNRWHRTA